MMPPAIVVYNTEFHDQHVYCALGIYYELRVCSNGNNLLSFESSAIDHHLMKLLNELMESVLDDESFIPLTGSLFSYHLLTWITSLVSSVPRQWCSYVDFADPIILQPYSRLRLTRQLISHEVANHSYSKYLCSAIPERQLRGISALPVWKQEGGAGSDGNEESYGVLPQPFITQVGEHMLALVEALEPFNGCNRRCTTIII